MAEATKDEGRKTRSILPEETREHLETAGKEFGRSLEGLFPPDFIDHNRRARREFLLAARSLIDHALEHLEETREA